MPLTVQRAIAEQLVVAIDYLDRNSVPSRREVEPIGVVSLDGDWYLAGWCRLRDDARTFRLDRIHGAELTGEQARSGIPTASSSSCPGSSRARNPSSRRGGTAPPARSFGKPRQDGVGVLPHSPPIPRKRRPRAVAEVVHADRRWTIGRRHQQRSITMTTTAAPVGWFEIAGSDPAKTEAFYSELFNWTFSDGPTGPAYRIAAAGEGIPGRVTTAQAGLPETYAIFSVIVPDVAATCARIEQLGGKVLVGLMVETGLVFANVEDPDGNHFGVFTPPAG